MKCKICGRTIRKYRKDPNTKTYTNRAYDNHIYAYHPSVSTFLENKIDSYWPDSNQMIEELNRTDKSVLTLVDLT